ncbi:hypothetical protein DFQ27_006724 [Actinomortierella ambigua]|uniref:Uncharacterized protein n=1 Tax=Actinomortierella ambigua TaxID=1343610 RepID=A0A9P6U042_9FUNG|nr:hypothetical protein DFQ27_006724 [Actinomortierella ambigua]
MAAPLSGDGPLPGAVFTDDTPSPQNIGFNETGDQPPQRDIPPPLPSQNPGGSKPQIEVNSTIQIVLISLGIVVALLFLFGVLAAYYIAHKNKKARQHQEVLDREEEQRRQRQLSVQKKHIAINTILDRKGNPSSTDDDANTSNNNINDRKGDAAGDRRVNPGGSLHLWSGSEAVLDSAAGHDNEAYQPNSTAGNDSQSNNGAGPRRESFLTLSPDGFGITLWPDTSSPSLGSDKGGSSSGVGPGTKEAALYTKEFRSQSQQGGRNELKSNKKNAHNSNSSSSHVTNRTALSSSSTAGLLHRGTPCLPGTAQGVPPLHSVGTSSNSYHAKVGQNTKNSFTEVAQIYAHRQSLVDPLGLQTMAVSTAIPPSSSGDRNASFPSPASPLASPSPPPLSSHSLSTSDWQQSLSTASQFHDPLTMSKDTSVATLSKRNEDLDVSNMNEPSTMYETAITIPSEMYDQSSKEHEGEEDEDDGDFEDSGAGVGTVKQFSHNSGYQQQQSPLLHQQESKFVEEPEEAIIYPKVVPRRKKSSNALHQVHHEQHQQQLQLQQQQQQQQQHHLDLAAYRQSIIVPNKALSSVEISYQPPSQPTSPTSDTFERPLRKAGLSHRGHQDSIGSGGFGGIGGGVGGGRGMGAGVGMGFDAAASAVIVNVDHVDESHGQSEEIMVMPQVVPRRPRTATFPHRPINYRHSQVYMHHESRPSLNINMNRRTMYGLGDLMGNNGPSPSSSAFDPSCFQRSQSPPVLQPPIAPAPAPPAARPDPFTVTRSKTVYDATKHQAAPVAAGRLQTTSSVSATTQRLRRKWAGGEIAIETTVPTHSGIGSSVGSIHSMRRNERSFAEEDYDDHHHMGPSSFPRRERTQRRTSFERFNGSGAGVGLGGGGGGGGPVAAADPEHVVVSLPSPRGCLLEDDQHNAEKQFYEMMNFLGGGPSGGNGSGGGSGGGGGGGVGGGGGHSRQQSYRNPYQVPAFPQHHQRFQSYTPSKRQSYYPPSQYQQQKQTYSYERTSFDRSFPQPAQPQVYQSQSSLSQSHRMSFAEDYYRAQHQQQHQQSQQQQQQQQQSTPTPRRDTGRRAQNALKRLSGIFGGGGNSSSNANEDAASASAAATTSGRGVGGHHTDDFNSQPRYREGTSNGQRRRGPLTTEEKIKRHSIAVMMNDEMFLNGIHSHHHNHNNQHHHHHHEESFYQSAADRFERQDTYPPPQVQQQHHQLSSSSMSRRPHHHQIQQQQQQQHQQQQPIQQYRQESSYSSRNSYRNDKSRRATMYGAISSMSGRYSSDLIRQADFYVESPTEELEGFHLGVGVGAGVGAGVGGGNDQDAYDHEDEEEEEQQHEEEEEEEEEGEGMEEEYEHGEVDHGDRDDGEEGDEDEEEADDGGVYYEAEEDAEMEEHREEEGDGDDAATEAYSYPEMEYSNVNDYGGYTRPKPLKQTLRVSSGSGGNKHRRAASSHGESVTVGALSSSSALDEEGVTVVKQPLKSFMRIFK